MLSAAGHHVNVVVAVPDYLTALAAAVTAPLVVTLPLQIAVRYAGMFGLKVDPAPVALKLPAISMIWSARSDREPSIEWLRQQIVATVKKSDGVARASLRLVGT
jgi:LysR family transcriptional activator of mexEF-oprN operon